MKRHTSKRWNILPGDIQAEARLQIELGVHPIVARLLVQRGIVTPEAADRFLNPTLDRLHDPFLLPDALPACERIKQALAQNEKILVHGDYDGDGVTSAALWTRVLRSLGADADVFVPNRSDG
jgi:single-stranded-DNA-specific exonuclease